MNIKKQDVGVWVKASEELPKGEVGEVYAARSYAPTTDEGIMYDYIELCLLEDNVYRFGIVEAESHYAILDLFEWLKPIKDVYVLTEDELVQLLCDYHIQNKNAIPFIKSITKQQ